MATINRFTLVQLASDALYGKPRVMTWNPSAYEEPALTTGHIILGVAMTDSDYDQPVAVMKRGFLRDVARQNSETWNVGDILYGRSDGSISNVRQAGPFPQVIVGTVFETVGVLHTVDVDVRVLPSLAELSGVTRETLANLDVLIYNGTTHAWVPRQIDHGGDIAGLLDDDHTQYLKEKASGGLASEIPTHTHQSAAEAGTLDHGLALTGLADDDHPHYKRKHGFENDGAGNPLVTLTYDSATRKVTVTPTGATFDYWIWGVKVTKTGAQLTPTGHAATTGGHFLTYNAAGNFTWSTTAWSIVDRTQTPVAFVYYYAGTSLGVCFFECHSADRWLEGHRVLHNTQGTKKVSGFALSGYTLNTDSDAAVTMQIASGVIADEDIYRTTSQVNDGGPYTVFYRTGAAGDWTWDSTPTFPFKFGTTYPSWNNVNAGGAGVWGMTELSGLALGDYTNYYLCSVPSVDAVTQLILIPGQATYSSQAGANGESLSSLTLLPTFPFQEIAPLYKLTFHARSTYAGTHQTALVGVTEITTGGASVLVGSSPSIHNTLSGRDATDAHPAASVTFTPYSTLAATDVQTAIQELLDEAGSPATLDSIGDVNAPTPGNGEVLTWDSTPGEWVSAALPATPSALADLTDVDLTGLASGDGLYWNPISGYWEPAGAPPPGAHASTHESGGSDPIALDTLGAPTDITTLDASISAHGLCPKGSNVAGEFLKSDLSWGAPATVAALDDLSDVNAPTPNNGDVLAWDSGNSWWEPVAAGTPAAHASSHENGGADEIEAESLGTAETDTALVLKPNGTGGVAWGAASGAGTVHHQYRFSSFSPISGVYPLVEMSATMSVVKVRAFHLGSGSLSVNVIKNQRGAPSDILASDLASSAAAWVNAAASGGSVSMAAGDELDVELLSVTGFVEYVVVVVDVEEALS